MGWDELKEKFSHEGVNVVALKSDLEREITDQDLSAAGLDYTTSMGCKFQLVQILIHSDQALTATVSVYFDSLSGANYDTLLAAVDFDNTQDVVLLAGDNIPAVKGEAGDEINIQIPQQVAGHVYVTYLYEEKP